MLRGVGGIDGGEIGRGADIGNDHAQVFRGNDVAHQGFDLRDFVFGDGEARAGRRFQIDHELAGVGAREEGKAKQGEEREADPTKIRPNATSVSAGRRNTPPTNLS